MLSISDFFTIKFYALINIISDCFLKTLCLFLIIIQSRTLYYNINIYQIRDVAFRFIRFRVTPIQLKWIGEVSREMLGRATLFPRNCKRRLIRWSFSVEAVYYYLFGTFGRHANSACRPCRSIKRSLRFLLFIFL